MWMLLVLVYGLLKGGREVVKKKCLERNGVAEVLFFYTLFGLLIIAAEFVILKNPIMPGDMGLMPLIFVKSFVIFLAWILSFLVIKNMPISLYGVIDMSRVLFAYFFGIVLLREKITVFQLIGMPMVLVGLFLLRLVKGGKNENEHVEPKYVIIAIISCALNAVSGFLDKVIMQRDITSGQLQFWYMLFMVILYGVAMMVRKSSIDFKTLSRNYWIPLLAIMFIIADRALFVANGYPDSKVTIMTLIKQSSCFVTIALGKIIYKEKNILKKAICAAVILAGILIAMI